MRYHDIESSLIRSVVYDEKTSSLEVNFRSNTTYLYQGVSTEELDAFLAAPSKGRYFNEHIKPRYEFARVA